MSTLKVSTIQDTSGNNSSTPAGIASGTAKAWVNFNGSDTVAIRASYNVSSITDNGTGSYTVNFTTAMPDANYVVAGGGFGYNESRTSGRALTFSSTNSSEYNNAISISSVRVTTTLVTDGSKADISHVHVAIFR